MKIKLVLSGSGTLYPVHVGALIRLAEAGYEFEEICGTSGGSIVAAALASGYKPNHELVNLIKKTLPHKNNLAHMSLLNLITKLGLINGDKIERLLEKYLVPTLGEATMPIHIVTTNVDQKTMIVFESVSEIPFAILR